MSRLYLDPYLVIPAILLSLIGLTILRSVAPTQVVYQAFFLILSTLVFLLFAGIDYTTVFALHFPIYLISLAFLALPFFLGVQSRGALRWLQVGQFSLQPSEIIKPFLLITFAMVANSKNRYRMQLLLLLPLIPLSMVFIQPDLGTFMVLLVSWFTIFLSQVPFKAVITFLLFSLLLLPLVYNFLLQPYQKDRLLTFLSPASDPLGRGYHVIQSTIAVGSGQLFGRGLGHGTQSQLRFLPEHHTDFIFASLSEELGLVGAGLVLILLLVLLRRIYLISQIIADPPASFFCLAATSTLAFQAIVNIGMNIGSVPVTGVTLPLLSYGGSSLLSTAIILGIASSISTHKPKILL